MSFIRKVKNLGHGLEADFARLIYLRKNSIPTIGITGTDGKTTTASLIFHILETAGYRPAMITTVGAQIGNKTYETGLHTTTPSAFVLQKYVAAAIDAKCDFLVLEITSHALDQNRARGIDFKIGVLTNITHEHLDYHGTYKKYVLAKARLFSQSGICILNRDDESYSEIKEYLHGKKIYSYSKDKVADFTPESLRVKFPKDLGFNKENFLAAVSVANLLGIDKSQIQKAINSFEYPKGRQEIVYDREFRAVVDFAHTPNSFSKVLPILKESTKGRLIHVFGCAGLRDASKRPLMGKFASENDDIIILTSEDPRSEKVSDINSQIKIGISGFDTLNYEGLDTLDIKKALVEIPDRQKAINFAVKIAKKGDTIVATGKGHEQSMNLGNGEIPWSDHGAFEKALKDPENIHF